MNEHNCAADLMLRLERMSMPEPNSGCWIWTGTLNHRGYGHMSVAGRMRGAHRVSLECVIGRLPSGTYACHRCNLRACVNPAHLYAGSPKDNAADSRRAGTMVCGVGEKNPRAKINASTVLDIRRQAIAGSSGASIARNLGISKVAVCRVIRGATWGHVS